MGTTSAILLLSTMSKVLFVVGIVILVVALVLKKRAQ
jgi:uncharacterized membrane protein YtjA (UPF0391 family)